MRKALLARGAVMPTPTKPPKKYRKMHTRVNDASELPKIEVRTYGDWRVDFELYGMLHGYPYVTLRLTKAGATQLAITATTLPEALELMAQTLRKRGW